MVRAKPYQRLFPLGSFITSGAEAPPFPPVAGSSGNRRPSRWLLVCPARTGLRGRLPTGVGSTQGEPIPGPRTALEVPTQAQQWRSPEDRPQACRRARHRLLGPRAQPGFAGSDECSDPGAPSWCSPGANLSRAPGPQGFLAHKENDFRVQWTSGRPATGRGGGGNRPRGYTSGGEPLPTSDKTRPGNQVLHGCLQFVLNVWV